MAEAVQATIMRLSHYRVLGLPKQHERLAKTEALLEPLVKSEQLKITFLHNNRDTTAIRIELRTVCCFYDLSFSVVHLYERRNASQYTTPKRDGSKPKRHDIVSYITLVSAKV